MKQLHHKSVQVDSHEFRKGVSLKLALAIKKVSGVKNFGNDAIAREIGAIAYKMGIKNDTAGGCRLKQFVPYVPDAFVDHIVELDRVLDKVNTGVKAAKEFGKRKI